MKKRNEKTDRNREIFCRRENGESYRQIADRFGISIIRVRQIIEVERAKEAAGVYPLFDWNQLNRENMEKMAAKLEKEKTDE